MVTTHREPEIHKPRFITASSWQKAHYYVSTRKAIKCVRSSLDKKITLGEIAAAACMERTAFSKMFRQKIGISLHEFVEAYRISKAAEQMEIADYSITEIALSVGFSNLETFERAFRRTTGCTPSRYRKEGMPKREMAID